MPDYRLIHRRALRGEKVGALTDFERGVWLAYLLIADDYGVMPFDAGELARAVWLKGKPQKAVQKALDRVRDVGLIQTWTHQGAAYCYAADWQEWQNVRHPRGTIEPCPPAEILGQCKPKTRELFAAHSRNNAEVSQQDDGQSSEESRNLPRLARTGGRETLTLTANADPNANAAVSDSLAMRAGTFVQETYPRLYAKHRKGARYVSKPHVDFQEALELCRVWDDGRLEQIATVFLTTDHQFAENGSRTIPQFRAMASWCDSRLVEAGIA